MNDIAPVSRDHGALMDTVYRSQRHFYDATRKYFLFGRDRLIEELDPAPGNRVLEIACGTGRNLARIAARWPQVQCYGLDISSEMLKSARRKLGDDAVLALGDATGFDPVSLFGQTGFDRIVLSFATSMIPDWQAAISQAARLLAPGGSLHIVDFGTMANMPRMFRKLLEAWLAHFHVAPRTTLVNHSAMLAAQLGLEVQSRSGPGGYYALVTLRDIRAQNTGS